MEVLLIVAHGSHRKESNEEIIRLANRIRTKAGPAFDRVECAFLEPPFTPQAIPTIKELIESGATGIKVFPYFLAAGKHVVEDIPRIVNETREAHPEVHIETLPHMGALHGLGTLILSQIYRGAPATPALQSIELETD